MTIGNRAAACIVDTVSNAESGKSCAMPCDHGIVLGLRHGENRDTEPDLTDRATGAQIPYPHSGIEAAADGDRAPVQLADGHRPNRVGVAGERLTGRVPGAQIPYPHSGIEAAADGDRAPVQLADGHRPNRVGVAGGSGRSHYLHDTPITCLRKAMARPSPNALANSRTGSPVAANQAQLLLPIPAELRLGWWACPLKLSDRARRPDPNLVKISALAA